MSLLPKLLVSANSNGVRGKKKPQRFRKKPQKFRALNMRNKKKKRRTFSLASSTESRVQLAQTRLGTVWTAAVVTC